MKIKSINNIDMYFTRRMPEIEGLDMVRCCGRNARNGSMGCVSVSEIAMDDNSIEWCSACRYNILVLCKRYK